MTTDIVAAKDVTCDNCPARSQCRFDQPRVDDMKAGFKKPGHKVENLAYRLITDSSEGNRTKEDFVSCQAWVEVFQPRARYGRQLREDGKDGEVLELIGREGDTIKRRQVLFYNGQGQVVKPQAEIIPALDRAGIKYNVNDNYPPVATKEVALEIVVPEYHSKTYSDYDREVIERHKAGQKKAKAAAEAYYEEEEFVPIRRDEPEEDVVSAPVKRGPGRPKKAVDG